MNKDERKQLTERLNILRDKIEEGKLSFAAHLADDYRASLRRVRLDSDGIVIEETVDSRVRALANMVSDFKYRDDTKKVASIADIQGFYFNTIERNFQSFYRKMCDEGVNPHIVATILSRDAEFQKEIEPQIDSFMEAIKEFWSDVFEVIEIHTEDMQNLKAVFGGDMFPSYTANLVTSCGLYVDTIVLPCPFVRTFPLYRTFPAEAKIYYVFKHALNLLQYKDAALADISTPLLLICPDRRLIEKTPDDYMLKKVKEDSAKHATRIFGHHIASFDELLEFLRPLNTPEKVADAVADPTFLLFDTTWSESLNAQIRKAMVEVPSATEQLSGNNTGLFIAHSIFGRMYQANDLLDRSRSLHGTPLIDAPTSWQYFNWKLQYDNTFGVLRPSDNEVSLHVMHALKYAAERGLCWLGNVPIKSVIDIRRQGAAEEVRNILSRGVKELAEANPDDFMGSTAQVLKNIDTAFAQHQKQILELKKKKLKLFGIDVASCLSVGSIAVTAALTSSPTLGAIAGAAGVAGATSIKDVIKNIKDIRAAGKKVEASPTGLFFRHTR